MDLLVSIQLVGLFRTHRNEYYVEVLALWLMMVAMVRSISFVAYYIIVLLTFAKLVSKASLVFLLT